MTEGDKKPCQNNVLLHKAISRGAFDGINEEEAAISALMCGPDDCTDNKECEELALILFAKRVR
ncbi:hypothetical protein [Magnetospirillum moscoviense]|uniref:hypothetical protein n=1 Tax=Magnetospirillum moscoviense TaxID=1437059 RepID=UPI0012E8F5E8|nr:hypothetical protein [Magnetospirillum moscoviense]